MWPLRSAARRFDRGDEWVDLHDHSLPAPVRRIVGDPMLVLGMVANVVEMEL
jgi:hypothetical protein